MVESAEQLFYLLALLVSAWIAIASVSELVTRFKYQNIIDSEIAKNSSILIQSVRVTTIDEPAYLANMREQLETGETVENPTLLSVSDRQILREEYELGMEQLKDRRNWVLEQNHQVSNELQQKLDKLQRFDLYQAYLNQVVMHGFDSSSKIGSFLAFEREGISADGSKDSLLKYVSGRESSDYSWINVLERVRSDHVLAILVMACATCGALISGLRGYQRFTLRTISLGISAGVIAYFAMRGGKSVLIFENSGSSALIFNPYGSAFLGLIAGLFTEKAFSLLSDFVDTTAGKFRDVAGIPTSSEEGFSESTVKKSGANRDT